MAQHHAQPNNTTILLAAATNDHVVDEAHCALVLCWELGCYCQKRGLLAYVSHHAEVVSITQLQTKHTADKASFSSHMVVS